MRRKKEIQGNFKVFDHKWSDTDALMRRKDYVRHSWGQGEVQGWKKALGINAFLPILILMFKAVQISCPNLFSQVPQQFILWTYLEALLSPLMATTFGGSQYNYPGVFLETQELSGRDIYTQRESVCVVELHSREWSSNLRVTYPQLLRMRGAENSKVYSRRLACVSLSHRLLAVSFGSHSSLPKAVKK